jgi:hypothetical protein
VLSPLSSLCYTWGFEGAFFGDGYLLCSMRRAQSNVSHWADNLSLWPRALHSQFIRSFQRPHGTLYLSLALPSKFQSRGLLCYYRDLKSTWKVHRAPYSTMGLAFSQHPACYRFQTWLLIADDPHTETGIPEGFGALALHRNTGIPGSLVSEIKANFPCE